MSRAILRLAGLLALAMPALAAADMHKLEVRGGQGDALVQFEGYRLGVDYHARLVPLEGSGISTTPLVAVARRNVPVVIADSFGGGKNAGEQGLLLVGGTAVSPFNFGWSGGRLDSVLCFRRGRVTLADAEGYRSDPARIGAECDAAVQVPGRIVRDGRSVARPSRALAAPAVLLAFKGREAWILIFAKPIYLDAVAPVLARPEAQGGFGFTDAVSLSANRQPILYYYGRPVLGAADRRLTVALTFDD
jgi:hypothetical protein